MFHMVSSFVFRQASPLTKMSKFAYLPTISTFKLFAVLLLLFVCLVEWKGNSVPFVILMTICTNLHSNQVLLGAKTSLRHLHAVLPPVLIYAQI